MFKEMLQQQITSVQNALKYCIVHDHEIHTVQNTTHIWYFTLPNNTAQ